MVLYNLICVLPPSILVKSLKREGTTEYLKQLK